MTNIKDRALKPCPFCGCKIISASEVYDYPDDSYFMCTMCPAKTWKENWNTRAAAQERKDAAIEAVREFVKQIGIFSNKHLEEDIYSSPVDAAFASMFPGESIDEK